MSVTVKYTGPSPEVEIPTLRLTCKHGDNIEVDQDVAASLVATGDWESGSTKVKKAAKNLAADAADPAEPDPAMAAPLPADPEPDKTEES